MLFRSPEDCAAVLEQLPLLERYGFRCEDFGGAVLVREVPGDIDDPAGALEELAEEGLIRADPDSGFEEFPAGLLLTVEDSIEADGRHTFSLQKYRSSLGAYCFYDCTARQEGDGWSYAVGAEMIP